MTRSFRFEPPAPRPGSLTRPRLLRALLGRWEHRVTAVVGGPGLGKTTLLAQAVAENQLAPRGEDVWIGLGPSDADGDTLARDALAAVLARGVAVAPPAPEDEAPAPVLVADAVWRLAPTAVCLVVDDGHWLDRESAGAAWLAGLVDALPDNGHLVVASRWAPPIPLARLTSQGSVLRLVEDDLRFSGDELAGFASRRGVPADRLAVTGGWPAMAELAASVASDITGDYLWEEVLEPLGPERRRVLAVVSDLGGADDGLAGAALGAPVDLGRTLDGIPLMAHGTDEWRVPHPLWRTVPGLRLGDDDRRETRRRAIGHLVTAGRYDEAVTLAADAGLGGEVPGILRAVSIGQLRPPARRLDRWLAALPDDARDTAGATLAVALRAALATPGDAVEPLRTAIARCRAVGDAEGELSALALLGRVAWWRSDLGLLAEIYPRVLELEAEGLAGARAIAGLGRAIIADLEGDDDVVLGLLDAIDPRGLDESWRGMADWLEATTLLGRGDSAEAGTILAGVPPSPDPALNLTVEATRLMVDWANGGVDEVVAALVPMLDEIRAAGVAQNLAVALSQTAIMFAGLGDPARAQGYLEAARQAASEARTPFPVRLSLAEASVLLADGDEAGAAAVLVPVVAQSPLDGMDRRIWRMSLPLTYVLLPSTRPTWDAAALHGHLDLARRLAAAVVVLREGSGGTATADDLRRTLGDVDLSNPSVIRAALHHRFAVTLALGLEAAGRPEGATLLEALGSSAREAVRVVASRRDHEARPARSLLAAVPTPPRQTTDLNVIGPLEVVRDGEPVAESELRRGRVRALLAYLVGQRATTRAAIMAALWPDLDERAAANNLRVTMTYLLRLLEPWRSARESSYFVRVDGPNVGLVTGDRLHIDLDRFDEHVARAARADADGVPSEALEHNLAAAGLYRGELHEGVADAEWLSLDRERVRARFVAAATRAGQLLAARGDGDEAEHMARRAVAVDPWAEAAHGVLVSVAMSRGDRGAARRALDRALAALDELGVEPSEETGRLRRRLRST